VLYRRLGVVHHCNNADLGSRFRGKRQHDESRDEHRMRSLDLPELRSTHPSSKMTYRVTIDQRSAMPGGQEQWQRNPVDSNKSPGQPNQVKMLGKKSPFMSRQFIRPRHASGIDSSILVGPMLYWRARALSPHPGAHLAFQRSSPRCPSIHLADVRARSHAPFGAFRLPLREHLSASTATHPAPENLRRRSPTRVEPRVAWHAAS